MRISIFTSCQPRHITLVEELASIASEVHVCVEVNTLFPGRVDDFFKQSDVMQSYFAKVVEAERAEFGDPRFWPAGVSIFPMKMRDLSLVEPTSFDEVLAADLIVVFGASYIRPPLADLLVERGAINIHMGTSPYYRGSSCNFWALYDGNADYVGATIHLLTHGLDSGSMLCHALPALKLDERLDGFALGMRAVRSAFDSLSLLIQGGQLRDIEPVSQDRTLQIRYTRNRDFTDDVAAEYLSRAPDPDQIRKLIEHRDSGRFVLI